MGLLEYTAAFFVADEMRKYMLVCLVLTVWLIRACMFARSRSAPVIIECGYK